MTPLFRPFAAYLASPEKAAEVAMPPVSSVTSEQWERLTQEKPNSFLHVMRSAIDSDGTETVEVPGITDGRARLDEMISSGVFVPHPEKAYYLHRLASDEVAKTGVVAEIAVAGIADGRVRRHEATRVETEERIAVHLREVGAHANPVALTYRVDRDLAHLVDRLTRGTPVIDFLADDDVQQTIWIVDEPGDVAALDEALAKIDRLYITDGHHRCAAAARLAAEEADLSAGFVGVVFPDDEIRLVEYNRCVLDLGGISEASVIAALEARMQVDELHIGWAEEARPKRRGTVSMWMGAKWYRLILPDAALGDPVAELDVARLQSEVLAPVFGIADPRTDPRLVYVPGTVGMSGLERRSGAACFALHPTSPAQVMAVADAELVMPPKSTWFEPKVHGGLIVKVDRMFDESGRSPGAV